MKFHWHVYLLSVQNFVFDKNSLYCRRRHVDSFFPLIYWICIKCNELTNIDNIFTRKVQNLCQAFWIITVVFENNFLALKRKSKIKHYLVNLNKMASIFPKALVDLNFLAMNILFLNLFWPTLTSKRQCWFAQSKKGIERLIEQVEQWPYQHIWSYVVVLILNHLK